MDFVKWIGEQRRGALAVEVGEELAALNQAVIAHDKPGTLTITIRVQPAAHGEMGTVLIADDVKVKAPVPDRQAAIWFVDEDYGLTRSDPRQQRLDFEVELAKGNTVIPPIGQAEGEVPPDAE